MKKYEHMIRYHKMDAEEINKFGQEGWQVCAVHNRATVRDIDTWVLKREIIENEEKLWNS